uniref:(northern house mosquito) hypothetical protein n=1 Tax=Culex pipiens TaxID=7175 RepID=A0A8D8AHC7_CULPI
MCLRYLYILLAVATSFLTVKFVKPTSVNKRYHNSAKLDQKQRESSISNPIDPSQTVQFRDRFGCLSFVNLFDFVGLILFHFSFVQRLYFLYMLCLCSGEKNKRTRSF